MTKLCNLCVFVLYQLQQSILVVMLLIKHKERGIVVTLNAIHVIPIILAHPLQPHSDNSLDIIQIHTLTHHPSPTLLPIAIPTPILLSPSTSL